MAALARARAEEHLTLQVILGPRRIPLAVPTQSPSSVVAPWYQVAWHGNGGALDSEKRTALRNKVSEAGFACTIRLGVTAPTPRRRELLLLGLMAALRASEAPGVQLRLHREAANRLTAATPPWRWPLRLGAAGTDAVVESHALRCTHVDAYRFFTPAARPRNALTPTRERQVEVEQPGCLHATMDLYKWAMRLTPAVPSELVADCFGLALALRVLDMRASPYDLSGLGYEPIAVETTEGKAEYVAAQRRYAAVGQDLRARLVAVCDALLAEAPVFAAPEVSANPVGEPESGLRLPPP